ncbi:putative ribosomal N-acetyltransferase YdaF [compost metagenome]
MNYINRTITSRNEKLSYPFIVIDKTSNQVAGSTRFGNIVFHNKRLEIGWTWYGENFRGTCVNKATKFELLRYVFEEMSFNRVQFSVDVENIRSQKAVLKLGAKQEGVFRSNYVNAKGDCRDDVYFSIIKSEWSDLKRVVFGEFF